MCVTQTPSPCEKRRCKEIRYRSGNGCQCFFPLDPVFQRTPRHNGNEEKKNDNATEKKTWSNKSAISSHLIFTHQTRFFSGRRIFLPFVPVIIILQHIFSLRFALYCLQFTPFQLFAVCFSLDSNARSLSPSLHEAQRVVIIHHLWNKLSKEIRETKWGILKRDTHYVVSCIFRSLAPALPFDHCI